MSLSSGGAYTVAIIGGAAMWQLTALIGGRREAWDSPLYFLLAYPAGMVLAGVLAHLHPVRAWRFALAMMWVQPFVMVVTSRDSSFGLLPLGLIMFGVLALPPIGVARVVGTLTLRKASSAVRIDP
jgi:hypothetical protein